jgi:hypothetical protein
MDTHGHMEGLQQMADIISSFAIVTGMDINIAKLTLALFLHYNIPLPL